MTTRITNLATKIAQTKDFNGHDKQILKMLKKIDYLIKIKPLGDERVNEMVRGVKHG